MDKIILDAEGMVLGRMASKIAKELLKGKEVMVVNAEKAIVSGNPDYTFKMLKEKTDRGDPYHGPFYPRRPEKIVKRVVRGMLPKKPRGREALKRLKVYISTPEGVESPQKFEDCMGRNMHKRTTLGDLSQKLGVKKTW